VLVAAGQACAKAKLRRVGVEADYLTLAQFATLQQALGEGTKLVRTTGLLEQLRAIKEPAEIERLREAVELSSRLFRPLLKTIRPGVRENEVAGRLEFAARRAGAEGMSFPTIVASGARSALPHGVASSAALPDTGFVVLDYGVVYHGYCSDMTRTVHLGRASEEARSLYGAVLEAQLAAMAAVHPGASCSEVDGAARKVLKKAKLHRYFTHSTGHGVGLEIHEPPRVGAKAETELKPGMVITIEPGAYLPGRYGVRIEDMVLVTGGGFELLTPVSKALIEL
jgi:Xaa-Pro aminopeptidase